MGVQVIGVSGDSSRTQGFFREKNNLNFPLLADESGAIAKAFGVAKTRVHLLAGAGNRDKRVAIVGPTKLPEGIRAA